MPFIDCANIACGYHAGDPGIMRKTVTLALAWRAIGAHRPTRTWPVSAAAPWPPEEIRDLLHYQIGALDGICQAQGARVLRQTPWRDVQRHDGQPAQVRGDAGRGGLRRNCR
ncbi:LamB/YcsF family protein [Pseudomonas peli]|uniref:LamB/YcsF family protein n=1 Tax=Pseudomonas peli TaxID=592361 RepID=UPI0024ACB42E|nr:LamB/YcsF family protein [Pseudomonas peli]